MELSDLIVDFQPDGTRSAVTVADARAALADAAFPTSRWLLERLPQTNGVLDDRAVDGILLRSHLELQRLAEEIQHGERVARVIRPLLDLIDGPKRVVDVGCGLGYLVRYLTKTGALGPDVEVVGFDFNRSLLNAARELARIEEIDVEFVAGDAFALGIEATVYISSGVIHHFEGDDLSEFFQRQYQSGASGCFHFDVAPTWLTPLGAWVFHRARMREPLARHDGVRSALRAHRDNVLAEAIKGGAPNWDPFLFDAVGRRVAVLNVMRPIIGLDPVLTPRYQDRLGRLASRLTPC